MKLHRSTWALLLIAIALGLGITYFETQTEAPRTTEETTGDPLYTFEEDAVQSLQVQREDTTLSFQKTEGTWQMIRPRRALAEPAAIAFLLNILTSEPTLETLTVPTTKLKDYGLDKPMTTLNVTLTDGTTHEIWVGLTDFSGDSRYVKTDATPKKTDEVSLSVISGGITNAIERPLKEWIAQSAAELNPSPTPDSSSTPSSTPAPEPSPTNDPSPAPEPTTELTPALEPTPTPNPSLISEPTPPQDN